MSRPHEPHRPSFPFGNPFRMIVPRGSTLKPRLLNILKTFEETLAQRFRKLMPNGKDELLSLSWMRLAMESICDIHRDIKTLIGELELPVCDWDDKWIDVYLDNSVKLLDICNAFSSELSRLNQGHLTLQCALHSSMTSSPKQFLRASSSLDGWMQHIKSKNPKLENCFAILNDLIESLNVPKVKKSSKGKVLMSAMYGVKVSTVFVFSVFISAFSGSAKPLLDLQVPETFVWAKAFVDLRTSVNGEIRNLCSGGRVTVLKDLEAVDLNVKKLHSIMQDEVGSVEAEAFEKSAVSLEKNAEKLLNGLDVLSKEVDGFFQIVLSGRDALLCNLRGSGAIPDLLLEKIRKGKLSDDTYEA